jgi:DNA-binding GntR family transcriptional regulator
LFCLQKRKKEEAKAAIRRHITNQVEEVSRTIKDQ